MLVSVSSLQRIVRNYEAVYPRYQRASSVIRSQMQSSVHFTLGLMRLDMRLQRPLCSICSKHVGYVTAANGHKDRKNLMCDI